MSRVLFTPTAKEMDDALQGNLKALADSMRDLLAALCLIVIAVLSLVHAVLRLVFAWVGLLLWSVALLIHLLDWLKERAIKNSASTLHRRY